MPFYEYECSSCRYYAEVMQKITDAPLRKCPSCGKNTFKKLISAPVFRLKGSGWYETDFKSDQEHKRNLAGADKKEDAAGDGAAKGTTAAAADAPADAKGEAKGEAKPAVAAETGSQSKREAAAEAASKPPVRRGASKRPARSSGKPAPAKRTGAARAKASRRRVRR